MCTRMSGNVCRFCWRGRASLVGSTVQEFKQRDPTTGRGAVAVPFLLPAVPHEGLASTVFLTFFSCPVTTNQRVAVVIPNVTPPCWKR
jgi:hypothetical protein